MAELAVTGSTGALGGRIARALADLGIAQRLIVRDAGRAPRLDGAEVREVPGGYADPAGFRAALEGVGTLFLVSAEEAPDRVAQHKNAVEAAAAAGVERIVYTSFLGAAPDSTFLLGRDHWATEEAIRAAGVAFTFLRDSFYMDVVPIFSGPGRTFRGPAGDGRLAPVSRDDVAAVAVQVLATPGAHDDRAYDLTGPSSSASPRPPSASPPTPASRTPTSRRPTRRPGRVAARTAPRIGWSRAGSAPTRRSPTAHSIG